ncbi:hypothetical protein [Bradyrhizobium sp. USDA 4353]
MALAALFTPLAASADEPKVRGVNPADIDTRVDVIGKYNWLTNGAAVYTTTLKYDYRVSETIGFNVEFPVLNNFRAPGGASPAIYFPEAPDSSPILARPSAGGVNDWGVGDVFTRIRYIKSFGQLSLGGALETVLPAASTATLGAGKVQLSPAALAVYAWSPALISAVVVKSTNSVAGQPNRPNIQLLSLRGIQAFVFPNRMFVTLDVQRYWETINSRDQWWETAVELGYQVNPTFVTSMRFSRKYGDRPDRGAIELAVKKFF